MDLRDTDYHARHVASDAWVETRDSYEAAISEFKSQKYTYMPLPETDEFYHIEDNWFGDIRTEQWVKPDTHLMDVFELLHENPILLVTDWEDFGEAEYGFINRSNINKRVTRDMIYPLIAEFERLVARRIEADFESEELFPKLSEHTVGSWVKDAGKDIELHIAESMDLGDMDKVLKGSEERLAKCCGFESKDELTDLDGIRELRNKVMHANKSLVREQEDILKLTRNISRTRELIQKANSGAAFD